MERADVGMIEVRNDARLAYLPSRWRPLAGFHERRR
jgi:hypothetical protein